LHLGVGTKEEREYLQHGNLENTSNSAKPDAILSVTLRNGPLASFCMLGRLAFDVMVSNEDGLNSDDTKNVWKALERTLDTAHLPFINASAEIWARG
jgi:hypothetical protein